MKKFNQPKTLAFFCLDSKADLLNKAILNILRSYMPNEKIKNKKNKKIK